MDLAVKPELCQEGGLLPVAMSLCSKRIRTRALPTSTTLPERRSRCFVAGAVRAEDVVWSYPSGACCPCWEYCFSQGWPLLGFFNRTLTHYYTKIKE